MTLVQRPKVGVALSAGALRGLCHLGFLDTLKREGIPIDFVAGTSIGAVIGSLYCAGLDLKMLADITKHLRPRHFADPCLPRQGFLSGKKVTELLRLFLRDKTFAQLETPLAVIACDLNSGSEVVLQEGSVVEAVRASLAVPGVFTPVLKDGQLLVDGGLVNRIPCSVVREMGADVVVAVKIGLQLGARPLKNVADIIFQSFDLMQLQVMDKKLEMADIVAEPAVATMNSTSLEHADECIAAGTIAAMNILPLLKSHLTT